MKIKPKYFMCIYILVSHYYYVSDDVYIDNGNWFSNILSATAFSLVVSFIVYYILWFIFTKTSYGRNINPFK